MGTGRREGRSGDLPGEEAGAGRSHGEAMSEEVTLESAVVPGAAVPDGRPVVGLTVTYCGEVLVHRRL